MGVPRSGTTFFASSLASHPKVVALPELHFVYKLMEADFINGQLSIDEKVDILISDFYFCSFNLFNNKGEVASFVENKTVRELVLETVSLYNKKNLNKDYSFIVEHSPHSHKYIELIAHYFPNSIFFHIIRDPRAVIASTYKEPWGFKDVITGSNQWEVGVKDILFKSLVFDIKLYRYEDVVTNFTQIFLEISEKLQISFTDSFYNNDGIVIPEIFNQKQKFNAEKLDSSRNCKWKNELSQKEIAHIIEANGVLMSRFCYPLEGFQAKKIKGLNKYLIFIIGKIKQFYMHRRFKNEVRKKFCSLS